MRRIVVSEFVTLDGVMEDPGGAEGFDRGGWAFQFERGPDGASRLAVVATHRHADHISGGQVFQNDGAVVVANQRAVRLFLRPDPFRRFLSCLVYLPRDHYTTSSRLAMSCAACARCRIRSRCF